jgi:hypothetical protein
LNAEIFLLNKFFNQAFVLPKVYAPAAVPWPSDVQRRQEWQVRENQRIAQMQAQGNGGKKKVF